LSEVIVPQDIKNMEYHEETIIVPPNGDIDWTTKGKVSSVKDQGQCGGCWAFAAVATSESWALFSNKTYDLS
jgi:cathepsin L